MKKLLILLLFPLMMFAQDTTLIGDVDCSGEVNSQDASLILQFVTNVIDELPCEANMTGLTPEQLQEMIDMMEEQLNINYTAGSGISGFNFLFPENLDIEPITWDLANNPYTVPVNKNLCITGLLSVGSNNIYIDDIRISYDNSNYSTSRGSLPYFASEGQTISSNAIGEDFTTINGFLTDKNIEPITWDLNTPYTVPSGKILCITGLLSVGSNNIYIDDIRISYDNSNYSTARGSFPYFAISEQVISSNAIGEDFTSLNGYLVDEDYFSSAGSGSIGGDENDSFLNPTFINPISIHGISGNQNLCNDADAGGIMSNIAFNVDSALNQEISHVILNIDFTITTSGTSYNCGVSNINMQSFNGVANTPIMEYSFQGTQGTQSSRTLISKQTITPLNNGNLEINIDGSGCCTNSEGKIQIVGYFSSAGSGSILESTSLTSDTVYSGQFSCSFSNFEISSDTISIPYIEGRDIFLTSNNLMAFYGCSTTLKIVDDNGVDISAKVIGSIDLAGSNLPAGYPINTINDIVASDDNNTINAIIRPYNLNTTNLYLFFENNFVNGCTSTGTMNYQY